MLIHYNTLFCENNDTFSSADILQDAMISNAGPIHSSVPFHCVLLPLLPYFAVWRLTPYVVCKLPDAMVSRQSRRIAARLVLEEDRLTVVTKYSNCQHERGQMSENEPS